MAKKERKLSLARQFRAVDTKQRKFLQTLNDEERSEFSPFLMLKYSANVDGITELESYYLLAANQRVNKHFFSLSRHPELQWLLCTTVSPNMGTHQHYWLKASSKKTNSKPRKFLENLFPHLGEDEIDIMLNINGEEDLRNYARQLGWDEKRIRDEL